jgi:hypothetical protein
LLNLAVHVLGFEGLMNCGSGNELETNEEGWRRENETENLLSSV